MKPNYFIILACFFGTLNGFCQNEIFKIEGTLTDDYVGFIYLKYDNKTDSCLVNKRSFTFSGFVDNPMEAQIHLRKGNFDGYFYLENSTMKIELSVEGTNTYINSMTGNLTAVLMSNMMEYFQNIESDPKFSAKLYVKLDTLITQNPKNQFCGMVLAEMAMDPILTYEQIFSLYSKLDTIVQSKNDIESLKTSMIKLKNIKIGTKFLDFELPDKNGNIILTQNYRGSVLLVEFWASWCGPCRHSNPELVKIYKRYGGDSFEVLGVSLDSEKELWIKAIKKDGLEWTNTIAKDGVNNQVLRSLGIQYLPSNYLIDQNGIILAINIRPSEIEEKLAILLIK